MPDPVTAVIGGTAVLGGVMSSKAAGAQANAANNAANLQAQSTDKSIALQKEMFDKQVEINQPWQEAGLKALQKYADNPAFSFTYDDMTASPDYQFRKQQGINALDMSAAARGKLLSGAQYKALAQYGQGLASEEYGNAYNRALQNFNTNQNTQLNLANIGRGAAGQTQNAMQNFSTGASNAITAQGNALAQGQIGAGNAYAQGISGIAQSANQGIGNALLYNMYSQPSAAQQMASFSNNNYTPIG